MPVGETRTGRVEAYDVGRGWGTVLGDDGERLGFHCTQIAGGARTIPVGVRVTYRRIAGHLGRWEAGGVTLA